MKELNSNNPNRIRPGLILVLACVLFAILVPLWFYKAKPTVAKPIAEVKAVKPLASPKRTVAVEPPAEPSPLQTQWGIEIFSLALTRADSAVELSYRIVAPQKTALLVNSNLEAYLVAEAGGAKIPLNSQPMEASPGSRSRSRALSMVLAAPHAGGFPPASGRLVAGSGFSILLPNPGGILRKGSRVSVVIGDARADNLTVE